MSSANTPYSGFGQLEGSSSISKLQQIVMISLLGQDVGHLGHVKDDYAPIYNITTVYCDLLKVILSHHKHSLLLDQMRVPVKGCEALTGHEI